MAHRACCSRAGPTTAMRSNTIRIIPWSGVSRITGRHSRLPCTRRWWMPAPRDQWRRVQLARFLIDYAGGHVSRMRFDASGRLTDFGMERDAREVLVDAGKPFQISDCPGHDNDISACNRPCGDSMPTDIRSFPFAFGAVTRRWYAGSCGETMSGPTRSHKSAASLLNSSYPR